MAGVVYLVQNPNDRNSMYALWDTGRIDPLGSNPPLPVTDGPQFYAAPVPPARALHITDWNVPSGYVFTHEGLFYPFGGAVELGPNNVVAGVPYTTGSYRYIDFSWNPNNTGQGYVLDVYGSLYNFGGATAPPRAGALWGTPDARRLEMQWSPFKRSAILDLYGGRNFDFPYLNTPIGSTDGYYQPRDWARDLVITDWGSSSGSEVPSGYLLTADGFVYSWGPDKPPGVFGFGGGGRTGQKGLALLSSPELTPGAPTRFAQVANGGQYVEYVVSTPPAVVAGGQASQPPTVVTTTTRPALHWSYDDPQGNSQAEWQLVVWPQAYVDVTDMSNPRLLRGNATVNLEGTDPSTRGVVCPVDLANGSYRMYVRAMDSSGLWSAWANRGWTQTVPDITGPSGFSATVEGFHVNLTLTAVPIAGQLAVFEYSDDAGLTWVAVRGAEAVTAVAVTHAVDRDVPFGLPRTYRGRLATEVPRKISEPSPERTVTVESYTFALTSCVDPTLGGEFTVFDPEWSRPRAVGVFEPLGAEFPILVSDGTVRARRGSIGIRTLSRADYARLENVLTAAGTLLFRDQFGRAIYCQVSGDWSDPMMELQPTQDEKTGLRFAHEHRIPLVEVARPLPVPTEDD